MKLGPTYVSCRMPFGLCNAPSTFQQLMERIFGDQHYQSLLLYLDDVIVFSSTVDEHFSRLDLVFGHFQKEGLKVKLERCNFLRQQVQYLGQVVSASGVSTDPRKFAAVADWTTPGTVSDLRSFLGFASLARVLPSWLPLSTRWLLNWLGRRIVEERGLLWMPGPPDVKTVSESSKKGWCHHQCSPMLTSNCLLF